MRHLLDQFLWRNFNVLSNISNWVSRRLTHLGKLVFTLMWVSAVVGIDTQNSLSFQIFSVSLAFLLVAIFGSWFFHGKFKIKRHLPRYCSVGQNFSYQLVVSNTNKLGMNRISVLDTQRDPRPKLHDFQQCIEPKNISPHFFDRFFRYPRWLWMIRNNTLSSISICKTPDIQSGQSVSVPISVEPLRRGLMHFSHVEIYQHDHLGLYRAKKIVKSPQTMLILPKRYRIPAFLLPGKRQHNPGGVANAGSIGDAEEFVSLREYQPGDSIRSIHWNSWAKTNRPIVKQYQEEYFSRYGLIFDSFGSSAASESFEEAVSLTSSFLYSLHSDDHLVDLMFVANTAYTISMGRGSNQIDSLLEVLASISLQKPNRFDELYASVEQNIHILSSVIIILLSIDPARERLLSLLQVHKIPYKIFLISKDDNDEENTRNDITHLKVGKIEAGLTQ